MALLFQEKDIDEIMYKLAEMKNELRVVNGMSVKLNVAHVKFTFSFCDFVINVI